MVTAEKRTLQIEARLKDFLSRDLSRTEKALVRFGTYGSAAFKKLVGATFNLKTALGGLLAGYGALQAISTVRKFGEEADALLKLAASTGDLVENLSELQAALELAGIKSGDFDTVLRALLTAERQAIDGSDKVRESFAALGVTLEDLQTLGPSAIFEKIAKGLGEFSTEQERALALSRLLPKQFLALLPVLGGGIEKFQAAIREARDVGATVTESQAKVSERLNDAFTKIQIALGGVSRALIEAFGPRTIALLERVSKLITENRDGVLDVAEAIGKGIVTAVNLAIDAVIGLIGFIESIPLVDLIDADKLNGEIAGLQRQLSLIQKLKDMQAIDESNKNLKPGQRPAFYGPGQGDERFGVSNGFNQGFTSRAVVEAMLPKEDEIRARIAQLQDTLQNGISGAMQKTREKIASELNRAVEQVRQDTGAKTTTDEAAATLGLPPINSWEEYAAAFGGAMQKIQADSEAAAEATKSVFRETKNQGVGFEPEDSPDRTKERLALTQQILSLAQDLEPVQQALRDIEQQQVVLSLIDAKEKGTINAQELATALGFVNAQFERAKSLVGGGNFFDGFNKGARAALRSWTDFTAAGEEAAATLVDGGLNGLTDAFADIITGTKSAKEAFKDFAKQMLSDLARIISKLIVMQTLDAILGYEDGGVLPAMEKGGIIPMALGGAINRNGGIARRPTVLFGEGRNAEAFVPLPDNRSIPVSFVGDGGGGGSQVNINITAMDSKDVQRVLLEQQGTLRTIFTNQTETKNGMRQVVRRAGV
jgi:lambda family phage tail tape measure protein